jgi:hypothetical protein
MAGSGLPARLRQRYPIPVTLIFPPEKNRGEAFHKRMPFVKGTQDIVFVWK